MEFPFSTSASDIYIMVVPVVQNPFIDQIRSTTALYMKMQRVASIQFLRGFNAIVFAKRSASRATRPNVHYHATKEQMHAFH